MTTKLYKRDDLAGILSTAVESGIYYWASVIECDTTDVEGYDFPKRIVLIDREDDGKPYTVTLNDIERAVHAITSGEVQVRSDIRSWIGSGDPGMVDAEAADVLVQVACFGKIVYG